VKKKAKVGKGLANEHKSREKGVPFGKLQSKEENISKKVALPSPKRGIKCEKKPIQGEESTNARLGVKPTRKREDSHQGTRRRGSVEGQAVQKIIENEIVRSNSNIENNKNRQEKKRNSCLELP